jgi:hypothetical protein
VDDPVDLLVDPRHGRHVRGSRLRKLIDDLGGVAGPVDEARAHAQNHSLGDACEYVRERKELIHLVRRVEPELLLVHAHRGYEVLMGEHAALGRSGRARGVDERREVTGLNCRDSLVHLRRCDLAAMLSQLF